MRLLRGLAGALLWIVSLLLGLVSVILCATIILLPVGLPLLGYVRRMFTLSLKLMLPRAVSHPAETTGKSLRKRGRKAGDELSATASDVKGAAKRSRKKARRARKKMQLKS